MIEISPQIELPRGDARALPFSVTDAENGEVTNLRDAEIDWGLYTRHKNTRVLGIDDASVSIQNRDDAAGTFEIKLESTSTTGLDLTLYKEYVEITDSRGDRTTFVGEIKLIESAT